MVIDCTSFVRPSLSSPVKDCYHKREAVNAESIVPVAFGTSGSLHYRIVYHHADDKTLLSPWHDLVLYGPHGHLACICKTPSGSWLNAEVASDEPYHPLRFQRVTPAKSTNNVSRSGKSNPANDYSRRSQPAQYADNAPWNIGFLPQTWAANQKGAAPLEVIEIGAESIRSTGEVYYVKPLGAFCVEEERGVLSWKILAIAEDDPMAGVLWDCADMDAELKGILDLIREWLRTCLCAKQGDKESVLLLQRPAKLSQTLAKITEFHEYWQLFQAKRRSLDYPGLGSTFPPSPRTLEAAWRGFTAKDPAPLAITPTSCPALTSTLLFDAAWLDQDHGKVSEKIKGEEFGGSAKTLQVEEEKWEDWPIKLEQCGRQPCLDDQWETKELEKAPQVPSKAKFGTSRSFRMRSDSSAAAHRRTVSGVSESGRVPDQARSLSEPCIDADSDDTVPSLGSLLAKLSPFAKAKRGIFHLLHSSGSSSPSTPLSPSSSSSSTTSVSPSAVSCKPTSRPLLFSPRTTDSDDETSPSPRSPRHFLARRSHEALGGLKFDLPGRRQGRLSESDATPERSSGRFSFGLHPTAANRAASHTRKGQQAIVHSSPFESSRQGSSARGQTRTSEGVISASGSLNSSYSLNAESRGFSHLFARRRNQRSSAAKATIPEGVIDSGVSPSETAGTTLNTPLGTASLATGSAAPVLAGSDLSATLAATVVQVAAREVEKRLKQRARRRTQSMTFDALPVDSELISAADKLRREILGEVASEEAGREGEKDEAERWGGGEGGLKRRDHLRRLVSFEDMSGRLRDLEFE
eukprot:TRINITY_DN32944_c0_g1_i1.p1 TRINITY_DN32944_c0_g1~~TRINITY_DN32944_c0_g1_i1.p1  ORF type:complete len:805 (-),score=120.82 TRINITY_DN32944_c0_g1_i1:600-3014(-)